jgi:RNA polymerase sigma-70 factor (ECF subfamily)
MERYVDGDRRAFERLHDRLTPRLKGFVMKLVRDDSVVDDLIQLAMLKAHIARGRFALRGGDPDGAVQAWYFTIARNVAMDHLRSQKRGERKVVSTGASEHKVASYADDRPSIEERHTRAEDEQEIIERVRRAIEQLPPGQREVLTLHKLQGMPMAEVAQTLQIREGAVRVRAHRGYKALARMLGSSSMLMLSYGLGESAARFVEKGAWV